MLAEQPVRIGRGNELELEKSRHDVAAALRRVRLGLLRLLAADRLAQLQEAQERQLGIVARKVIRSSPAEAHADLPSAL